MRHLHWWMTVLYVNGFSVGWVCQYCHRHVGLADMNQFFREQWQ